MMQAFLHRAARLGNGLAWAIDVISDWCLILVPGGIGELERTWRRRGDAQPKEKRAMKTLHYILGDDGRTPVAVDLLTWGRWLESQKPDGAALVGLTRVEDAEVSTVFIGLNQRHRADGPPLLFETLVFGGRLDGQGRRYATYDQAETGHLAMVHAAAEAFGCDPPPVVWPAREAKPASRRLTDGEVAAVVDAIQRNDPLLAELERSGGRFAGRATARREE
jgi:hypothetical protein